MKYFFGVDGNHSLLVKVVSPVGRKQRWDNTKANPGIQWRWLCGYENSFGWYPKIVRTGLL